MGGPKLLITRKLRPAGEARAARDTDVVLNPIDEDALVRALDNLDAFSARRDPADRVAWRQARDHCGSS